MNARNRNLILVTNQLDAVSYYVVGTLRLLLSDPLFFLIGYWYGDTALDVDGAAHQVVRQDAAAVGAVVRQGGVPARVHRAQQRTSACSPARRA